MKVAISPQSSTEKSSSRHEIGRFNIGIENMRLWADTELGGGYVLFTPEDNGTPIICVGFKDNGWPFVVGTLVHEAMEFALIRNHARFESSTNSSIDTGGFQFCFNHIQFTRACEYAGQFMADATPVLAKAFNKIHKSRK